MSLIKYMRMEKYTQFHKSKIMRDIGAIYTGLRHNYTWDVISLVSDRGMGGEGPGLKLEIKYFDEGRDHALHEIIITGSNPDEEKRLMNKIEAIYKKRLFWPLDGMISVE